MTLRPDGKLYVHSGVGNLGTLSTFDTVRAAADVLDLAWEKVDVTWGDTSKGLPFSVVPRAAAGPSSRTRAPIMQRRAPSNDGCRRSRHTIWAAVLMSLRCPASGCTCVATRAGAYRSRRPPSARSRWAGRSTGTSSRRTSIRSRSLRRRSWSGSGSWGWPGTLTVTVTREMHVESFIASFAEVEVDVETGQYRLVDYLGRARLWHGREPPGCRGSNPWRGGPRRQPGPGARSGCTTSNSGCRWPRVSTRRSHSAFLDMPLEMDWDAVNLPDGDNAVGAKGIGEAAMMRGRRRRCAARWPPRWATTSYGGRRSRQT